MTLESACGQFAPAGCAADMARLVYCMKKCNPAQELLDEKRISGYNLADTFFRFTIAYI